MKNEIDDTFNELLYGLLYKILRKELIILISRKRKKKKKYKHISQSMEEFWNKIITYLKK